MLTHARLLEVLHYDVASGAFTLKIATARRPPGIRVDRLHIPPVEWRARCRPYMAVHVDGKNYRASRLAWFYMTSEWPKHEVDHRDINPLNNAWVNLREATRGQNQANTRIYRSNKLGIRGVFLQRSQTRPYRVLLQKDGRRYHYGYFADPMEAKEVADRARAELYGEFAA